MRLAKGTGANRRRRHIRSTSYQPPPRADHFPVALLGLGAADLEYHIRGLLIIRSTPPLSDHPWDIARTTQTLRERALPRMSFAITTMLTLASLSRFTSALY
jgi:hypothetical protein